MSNGQDTEGTSPVYMIVGASGGIGSELSRMLVEKGAKLMLAGRNKEKVEDLASKLNARSFVLDARKFDEVENCVKATIEEFGKLDGVVNCVGSILLKPAHLTSESDFVELIATNLNSAFACVRSGAKAMRENGGSIVLVSSAAAKIGLANHEAIAAAKAGIAGLALAASSTYARQNIRVNCVAPGLVETPLSAPILKNDISKQTSLALHPLGRFGKPSDIASAICWLLDANSAWITGQTIAIDGGLSSLKGQVSVK